MDDADAGSLVLCATTSGAQAPHAAVGSPVGSAAMRVVAEVAHRADPIANGQDWALSWPLYMQP